jgi:vacuolar-type H+-ATPase subunit I/STV1
MNKNVGTVDRVLRIIVGIVLITWGIISQNWFGLIGIVPLLTATIGWCPLYSVLKINTICKNKC